MKNLNERQALLVAIGAASSVLVATFALAWAMRSVPSSMRLPNIATTAQAATVTHDVRAIATQGRHLFLMNCAHCHGDDAHGDEGPDLYDVHRSDARIHQVITGGIKGEMPSFAKKLNDSDIQALTAYLRTLRT